MAFNVSTFKSKMKGDGARPNLFKVSITGTSGFWEAGTDDYFFCRASSIPGATLGAVVVPYFGREIKFAGNRTFADWTVTVVNDENFSVRERLEQWMNRINGHTSNLRLGDTGSYFATGTVTQMGKELSQVAGNLRTYNFNKMFPVDLSEITLDWGDNDSIEEFTVTFAYDYWTAVAGTASGERSTKSIT